jgi:hypothetical protein
MTTAVPGQPSKAVLAAAPWVFTVGFFLVWEIACRALGVSTFVLPPPSAVAKAMWEYRGPLAFHSAHTLWMTLAGFAIAVVTGLLMGIALGTATGLLVLHYRQNILNGASKLAGERSCLAVSGDNLIVRISSVFGIQSNRSKGGNFIDKILARVQSGENATVPDDNRMSPTYAVDAGAATLALVQNSASGVWHASNPGSVSWFELAKEVGLKTEHLDLAILGGKHSRAFTQDLQEAQELGLRGVPYFIFDRKVAIHGAREVEAFEQALMAK